MTAWTARNRATIVSLAKGSSDSLGEPQARCLLPPSICSAIIHRQSRFAKLEFIYRLRRGTDGRAHRAVPRSKLASEEAETVMRSRRIHTLLWFLGLTLIAFASGPAVIADAQGGKLRFGVGPLQPTPSETKKGYEPFF